MARSFALSFAAIDILLERLELGPSPFPFEIPHYGQTHDERAIIRTAVIAELRRKDLTDAAADMVRLFAKPRLVITAFGKLDDGPLFARICGRGQRAVKAVGAADSVHFEQIRPTGMVAAAMALLPVVRAGVGQSVTVSGGTHEEGLTRPVRGSTTAELYKAKTMMEREKLRFGQFRVGIRDATDLFWFDTTAGRYVITTSTGRDGQSWTTISPADNARIAQLLATRLGAQ